MKKFVITYEEGGAVYASTVISDSAIDAIYQTGVPSDRVVSVVRSEVHSLITEDDLTSYKEDCGVDSAINLLLLVGPDGFDGDYGEAMSALENELNNK